MAHSLASEAGVFAGAEAVVNSVEEEKGGLKAQAVRKIRHKDNSKNPVFLVPTLRVSLGMSGSEVFLVPKLSLGTSRLNRVFGGFTTNGVIKPITLPYFKFNE
jgi:hypothetical protein